MRIGIDCRLWNETGVGRYIRNLVTELEKIDSKNEYVLFLNSGVEFKVQSSKFKVVTVDIRWHSIDEQLRFPSILEKENLDLVHFPYFSVPLLYNKPFIITIHDLILHHFPTGEASTLPLPLYWIKQAGYRLIIRQATKRAKKIIAVSQSTKNEIVDHLGVNGNKIVVAYEGVDKELSSNNHQLTNTFASEKFFLYVGNAYPHKNLDLLIDAFGKVQKEHRDVSLVFVGKEDYFYKRLKDRVKSLKLNAKIRFYGYATDEELGALYEKAMALVCPSKMEGFGLPMLEAMARECLVVASDIPVF
ncbi:MAG: glycosyltransferase family 1 protein, partial [Patescibacteria group bacterium]